MYAGGIGKGDITVLIDGNLFQSRNGLRDRFLLLGYKTQFARYKGIDRNNLEKGNPFEMKRSKKFSEEHIRFDSFHV